MPDFDFDVLLIGAGQSNVPLGPKLVKDGHRVGLIERKQVGGSCVNFGCMPSKSVHSSARVAHLARHGAGYGIEVGDVNPILKDVLARARVWTEKARGNIRGSFEQNDVRFFDGHARLAGKQGSGFKVEISKGDGSTETVTAKRVVLDPGSRTVDPGIDGLEDAHPITSESWIDRDDVGRRLVILGGGYIGVEMAQFYRRMGHDVTLVQKSGQILGHEDEDMAAIIQDCLAGEGVTFLMETKTTRVEKTGDGFRVHLDGGEPIDCDTIFNATGRRPNTDDLGLNSIGVETDDRGAIATNDYGEVDGVPNLYAVGDCRGGPAFTHTAHDDHHILLGRLRQQRDPGGSPVRTKRIVPWAVFTDPELGRVGKAQKDAPGAKIVTVKMKSNDRARVIGEGVGLVKLVLDPADPRGKLLGATIVGPAAGELVHAFVMLMHLDQPLESILDAVFIHPTLFEVVHQAVDTWHKQR
jgi:pyruvate/2-oxoglutarate dehydrogenase complex dihydrolipoamide dehydrogenase (E3) component